MPNKPAEEIRDTEEFGKGDKDAEVFTFDKSLEPGLYLANLHFADAPEKAAPLAVYGQVFNVDTLNEGSLARIGYDDIDKNIIRELAARRAVILEGPDLDR